MTLLYLDGQLWLIPVIAGIGAIVFWYQVIKGYNSDTTHIAKDGTRSYSNEKTLPVGPFIAAVVLSLVTILFLVFG